MRWEQSAFSEMKKIIKYSSSRSQLLKDAVSHKTKMHFPFAFPLQQRKGNCWFFSTVFFVSQSGGLSGFFSFLEVASRDFVELLEDWG